MDASVENHRTPPGVGRKPALASPGGALVLATVSFTLSFAAWGLVGGLASVFAGLYQLTASQTALLVAVPVLLGSLARLPMGMLTDRFGGRLLFTGLLLFSSLAAFVVPLTRPATARCWCRRSSSAWPARRSRSARRSCRAGRRPARQGTALGHLRPGHDGAVAGGLRRAGRRARARAGRAVFRGTSAVLLVWAVVYVVLARNPPHAGAAGHGRGDGVASCDARRRRGCSAPSTS